MHTDWYGSWMLLTCGFFSLVFCLHEGVNPFLGRPLKGIPSRELFGRYSLVVWETILLGVREGEGALKEQGRLP